MSKYMQLKMAPTSLETVSDKSENVFESSRGAGNLVNRRRQSVRIRLPIAEKVIYFLPGRRFTERNELLLSCNLQKEHAVKSNLTYSNGRRTASDGRGRRRQGLDNF